MDVGTDDIQDEVCLAGMSIKFEAIVYKVQTLSDGGVRVTLDLPESAIPEMAMLAQTKVDGIALEFEVSAKDR